MRMRGGRGRRLVHRVLAVALFAHENLAVMFGIAHSEWSYLQADISLAYLAYPGIYSASYVPAIPHLKTAKSAVATDETSLRNRQAVQHR